MKELKWWKSKMCWLPTVAELKVVLPSTTFLFPVIMVVVLPSPQNIIFLLLLGTFTFSLYTPALILIIYLRLLLAGAAATAADTVRKSPLPSAATTASGVADDEACKSLLSAADIQSGQLIASPSTLSSMSCFLLMLWFAMSVSVRFLISANAMLHNFSTWTCPASNDFLTLLSALSCENPSRQVSWN